MKKIIAISLISIFASSASNAAAPAANNSSIALPAAHAVCTLAKTILTKAGMQLPAAKSHGVFVATSVIGIAQGGIILAMANDREKTGNAFAAGSMITNNLVSLVMHAQKLRTKNSVYLETTIDAPYFMNTLLLGEIAATALSVFGDQINPDNSSAFKTAMDNLTAALDAAQKAIISGRTDDIKMWNNVQIALLGATALTNLGSAGYYGCMYEKPLNPAPIIPAAPIVALAGDEDARITVLSTSLETAIALEEVAEVFGLHPQHAEGFAAHRVAIQAELDAALGLAAPIIRPIIAIDKDSDDDVEGVEIVPNNVTIPEDRRRAGAAEFNERMRQINALEEVLQEAARRDEQILAGRVLREQQDAAYETSLAIDQALDEREVAEALRLENEALEAEAIRLSLEPIVAARLAAQQAADEEDAEAKRVHNTREGRAANATRLLEAAARNRAAEELAPAVVGLTPAEKAKITRAAKLAARKERAE